MELQCDICGFVLLTVGYWAHFKKGNNCPRCESRGLQPGKMIEVEEEDKQ